VLESGKDDTEQSKTNHSRTAQEAFTNEKSKNKTKDKIRSALFPLPLLLNVCN